MLVLVAVRRTVGTTSALREQSICSEQHQKAWALLVANHLKRGQRDETRQKQRLTSPFETGPTRSEPDPGLPVRCHSISRGPHAFALVPKPESVKTPL